MPSESLTIEHDLGPDGMAEEITMSRKRSVPKKRPEEVRVNWVVDLVDPPQPAVEPAEPEPEPPEEWLSGVSQHLANALRIATAECARLALKWTSLAAELEEANALLFAAKARVRELEGVLKHIDGLVSSALPKEDDPAKGNGETT
jgi:hypothetical protein